MANEYVSLKSVFHILDLVIPDKTIKRPGKAIRKRLKELPTADVVEVVRCKDCIFSKKNYLVNGLCLCEKTIYDHIKGEIPRNTLMTEDDFCSYGERKEGAEE